MTFENRCGCGMRFETFEELKAHQQTADHGDLGEGWNLPRNGAEHTVTGP